LPRAATPTRRPALLVCSLLAGAVALSFLLTVDVVVMAPALLVATVARSSLMPLLVMTLMDHRDVGPTRVAAATGLFFTSAQVGGVAGPAITGILAEVSDGFRLPLAVHSSVMVAVALAIALRWRRALI
ncbi:MAG: hypothetical protein AAF547_18045, partial [Actinomycetota bacterium]